MASDVQNKNVGCEYYANGWLKKETLPNGYSNNYVYDGAGRMTELNRIDANGISALKYSYTYEHVIIGTREEKPVDTGVSELVPFSFS